MHCIFSYKFQIYIAYEQRGMLWWQNWEVHWPLVLEIAAGCDFFLGKTLEIMEILRNLEGVV